MLRTLAAVERGGAGAAPQLLAALLDPAARDERPVGPSAMERRCREEYARRPGRNGTFDEMLTTLREVRSRPRAAPPRAARGARAQRAHAPQRLRRAAREADTKSPARLTGGGPAAGHPRGIPTRPRAGWGTPRHPGLAACPSRAPLAPSGRLAAAATAPGPLTPALPGVVLARRRRGRCAARGRRRRATPARPRSAAARAASRSVRAAGLAGAAGPRLRLRRARRRRQGCLARGRRTRSPRRWRSSPAPPPAASPLRAPSRAAAGPAAAGYGCSSLRAPPPNPLAHSCPVSTEGGTRRVQLVRKEGRDVSS